jgi:tetratricopeptide (TPR) repeat protein
LHNEFRRLGHVFLIVGSELTMAETITLRAYLDELNRMLEQEALTEVISHCRHILQHFPQNINTYRLLAKALLEKGHRENLEGHFAEADELFRRVLAAVPNDYVAHLGLSEIHNRGEELDRAIWHLERAYEQMPGNAMLQDALRELYARRDGEEHAPARIQLTRGALARQYMNGQLYDQAAAELQAALVQHPDRVDLQVLLAEALWSGWHEVEAGEAAVRVLKSLPNCLAANRILAQLWLDNERPTDARPFLDRVEALDPYTAADILQPGIETFDHVELDRLDYYAQSQAELSTQTPGWVHDLEKVADSGDLWGMPAQGAEERPASAPARLDMAALFGEETADRQGDDSASQDWAADWPPEPDVEWTRTPPMPDELPAEPEPLEEMQSARMGAAGDAALEADWLLGEEELRAVVGDDDLQALESAVPEQDPLADLRADDDLLASLGIFDAEWQAMDEREMQTAPPEEVTQPGGPPTGMGEPSAGDLAPAAWEYTWDEDTPSGDAAFIDRLGEPPDFEQQGSGEIGWPLEAGIPGEVAPGETEGGTAVPAELADEGFALVTSDELRFLDEFPLADGDSEVAHSETARDDFDALLQGLLLPSEPSLDPAGVEGAGVVAAPEWLPSWDADLSLSGEADLSAASSEVPQLDEWLQMEQEAPWPGAPGEGAVQTEALAGEADAESLAELEEPMAWMSGVADVGEVMDADLLEALAVAGQAEAALESEEPVAAQPALDLPDWILEAAPLSERPTDERADGEGAEAPEALAAEAGELAAEEEPGRGPSVPAGWEAAEAAQAFDWASAGALAEEGAAGAGAEDSDWLDALVQPQAEPEPGWYGRDESHDAPQEWPEEKAAQDASPAADDQPAEYWGRARAEDGGEDTMPEQPVVGSGVEPAEELEGPLTGLLPAEGAPEEQWPAGADAIAGDSSPAWLEGLLGQPEEGIPAELVAEDLAALLDQQYDPYEDRGPDMTPQYDSAHETGILQPDERPDWMAAFTGEVVLPELDERIDALLRGELDAGDRTTFRRAAPGEAVAGVDDLMPAASSGDDDGEPALAYDTDFPYLFGMSAEEGDIPSWLLAIADSEADKLDGLFAGEAASAMTQAEPETAPSEEVARWPAQEVGAEGAEGYAPEETHPADSVASADTGAPVFEDWGAAEAAAFAAETQPPGGETPFAEPAEDEWSAPYEGGFDPAWAEGEVIAAEPEPDWSDAVVLAEAPAGGLPDDFDDELVPEDFSFGDWLPIWLREPLERGQGRSLGLRRDDVSEPPEWLRDVSEDEK